MNVYTVIIPHYRNGRMTAYCLSQLLKHDGWRMNIIVVNNSPENDPSLRYLEPFRSRVTFLQYPTYWIQSHGAAFDFALPHVTTTYFITLESDSFPTESGWLNYYDKLVAEGFHAAGSVLSLSGGTYLHPAGALYRRDVCEKASAVCRYHPYAYVPNISQRDGFDYHLMVHYRILDAFCRCPDAFHVTVAPRYTDEASIRRAIVNYRPLTGLFHNGCGNKDDSLFTYSQRNFESEPPNLVLTEKADLIHRVGYEPGQFLAYCLHAQGRPVFYVTTETKWLPNRENQQQEFTLTEFGLKHLWGMTAYDGCAAPEHRDIVEFKRQQLDELYGSLPAGDRR